MKKSFIVIGLGLFGKAVTTTIQALHCEVLAIDIKEEEVRGVADEVTRCAVCDGTSLAALKSLGVENMTDGVIAVGDLQTAILALMNLKELGVERVTVKTSSASYEPIFKRLGADKTVVPEESSGRMLAHSLVANNVSDYYQISHKYSIVRMNVKDKFAGRSLLDIDSRNKYDVNIIGVFRGEDFFIPKANDLICGGDELYVIGKNDKIDRFDFYLNKA